MEVIALKGEANCGKTHTLNIVYTLLLQLGCTQVCNHYKDLSNGDCRDVLSLNRDDKIVKVGIVTQGDWARARVESDDSVKTHLQILKDSGCGIAICACTTGKIEIQKAIEKYPKYQYIDKNKCSEESLHRIEDFDKAQNIMNSLKSFLKQKFNITIN